MQSRREYHNKWAAIKVHTLKNPISRYRCLFYSTSNNISDGGSGSGSGSGSDGESSTDRSDIVRGDNSDSGAGRDNRIDGGSGIVCTCSGAGRGCSSSSGIGNGTSRGGGGGRSSQGSGVRWSAY